MSSSLLAPNAVGLRERLRASWRALTSPAMPAPTPARRRIYAGAESSRLTGDWITSLRSMNLELRSDLKKLRGASRMLMRDVSYAVRFVNLMTENVLGAHGIRLKAQVPTLTGSLNVRLNSQLEAAWHTWADEHASVDGQLAFSDIEALALRSLIVDGEYLIRLVPGEDNPFSFALQLLDADQLDVEYNGITPSGNRIRMGVELSSRGRPIAYHVWTSHPSDPERRHRRERLDASTIIHKFLPLRAGQVRGLPWFAPVLFDQKMLAAFQEAAVTAARVGASNAAAVAIDPEKAGDLAEPERGESNIPLDVEPGSYMRLRPGESLTSTDWDYPSLGFGDFCRNILQSIAAGLGPSYSALTGDLTGVNFSSIRTGLLADRDFYRRIQWFQLRGLNRPVYREWTKFAPLSGLVPARDPKVYQAVKWQPRGWLWVDPLKDGQAAELDLKNQLTTRSRLCAEKGEDYEEILLELKAEQELRKTIGIDEPVSSAPAAKPNEEKDEDDEKGDEPDQPPTRALRAIAGGKHG